MEIFYSLWFWIGIIAVVGIVAGVITHLEAVETRLAVIEKTLTDIP